RTASIATGETAFSGDVGLRLHASETPRMNMRPSAHPTLRSSMVEFPPHDANEKKNALEKSRVHTQTRTTVLRSSYWYVTQSARIPLQTTLRPKSCQHTRNKRARHAEGSPAVIDTCVGVGDARGTTRDTSPFASFGRLVRGHGTLLPRAWTE